MLLVLYRSSLNYAIGTVVTTKAVIKIHTHKNFKCYN